MSIENMPDLVLKNLTCHYKYAKRVLPHLIPDYFDSEYDQKIFAVIKAYVVKYNKLPTKTVLDVWFKERDDSRPELNSLIIQRLEELENVPWKQDEYSFDWLIDETEKWITNKAVVLSLYKAIDIHQNKPEQVHSIPSIVQEALQVNLRTDVGMDYFGDYADRYERYQETDERYPTHLRNLNKAIGGGFKRKSLSVFLAQPGGGKSRLLLDLSTHYVKKGYDVAFITLELPEIEVGLRADANLLNYPINDIHDMNKQYFMSKFKTLNQKSFGKFFIKEYPMASINVNHIRSYLEELYVKKSIKLDFLIVDYLGVMLPLRHHANMNSFTYYKHVSQELKGLAAEYDLILLTAAQFNREGWNNTVASMKNIAESAGIAHVADLLAGIVVNDELQERSWIGVHILKNRLYKLGSTSSFYLGYDDDKMRHFDVTEEDREEGSSSIPTAQTGAQPLSTKIQEIDHGD